MSEADPAGGQPQQAAGSGWEPPTAAQPGAYQPPPAQAAPGQQQAYQQPGYAQYQQPYHQQPAGGYGYYGYPQYPAYPYHAPPKEPDNGPAITGFVLSVCSIGALVLFIGFLAPVTVLVSIASTIVSRNGIKKVDRGETRKNRDLARWGFWLGVAGIVLSILAIAAWVLIITLADFNSSSYDNGDPAAVLAALR